MQTGVALHDRLYHRIQTVSSDTATDRGALPKQARRSQTLRSPFGIADVEDDPLALLQCHVPETLPIDGLGIQDTLVDDAYAIRSGLRRLGRAARRGGRP